MYQSTYRIVAILYCFIPTDDLSNLSALRPENREQYLLCSQILIMCNVNIFLFSLVVISSSYYISVLRVDVICKYHYDVRALSYNPGLQYPHLHGLVHTPDNNRWDTPPV